MTAALFSLEGRRALVTGASRGLGAAIAGVSSVLQGGWFKVPLIGNFAEKLKL